MSLSELLGNVGFFGGAVMLCLAVISIYSMGLILDKHRRFKSALRQSQAFKPEFMRLLHAGELHNVVEAANQNKDSYVAQVVSTGVEEYESARKMGGDPAASFELVTSTLETPRPRR
jgi:biopolymer transport protein ExbB